MSIDYSAIGKFAEEKVIEYGMSMKAYQEIILCKTDIDHQIAEAELNHDNEKLESLYNEYRNALRDERANKEYRQKFCDDFMFAMKEMIEENENKK